MVSIVRLIASILACQAAGLIGSLFTARSVSTWYLTLSKPSFNPPNWVFGPVWTALFLLMGISLYLVWMQEASAMRTLGLWLFLAQLVLNIGWSALFFGLRSPGLALIEIIVLWLLIAGTAIAFWQVSRPAALLLVPYLLWVGFATVLNAAIYMRN
jgi:tryptophan-rich sensory protein